MEIGMYTIEWINEDYLIVTCNIDGVPFMKRKICGGDLETALSTVFMKTQVIELKQD